VCHENLLVHRGYVEVAKRQDGEQGGGRAPQPGQPRRQRHGDAHRRERAEADATGHAAGHGTDERRRDRDAASAEADTRAPPDPRAAAGGPLRHRDGAPGRPGEPEPHAFSELDPQRHCQQRMADGKGTAQRQRGKPEAAETEDRGAPAGGGIAGQGADASC